MKLCPREFKAMQSLWRRWYIRKIELATFKKLGLRIEGRDILCFSTDTRFSISSFRISIS